MSIEDLKVIDAIGDDVEANELTLAISDHLLWVEDPHEHLLLLQEKLNTYLAFLESGEVFEHNPAWQKRVFVIELVSKFLPTGHALDVIEKMSEIVKSAGFRFRMRSL